MATEKVVIDASAAVQASLSNGWKALGRWRLVAPSLLWSESAAGIAQLEFRREITAADAKAALERLLEAVVESHDSRDLILEAHVLARQLGWAKTYDAEFVVLARKLGTRLLTVDARLAATAARFVPVIGMER